VIANQLGIAGSALDGSVASPIIGAQSKREALAVAMAERKLGVEATLAVGDGANDIPMIEAAGLGVAYHAKPKTRAAASAAVLHGDLSAILYAMGYKRSGWVGI
jgi:phosphoserine phosphatase